MCDLNEKIPDNVCLYEHIQLLLLLISRTLCNCLLSVTQLWNIGHCRRVTQLRCI